MNWIPVTERLPDDDREVLAYNRKAIPRYSVAICEEGDWYNSDTEFMSVTHWMELPEGPK